MNSKRLGALLVALVLVLAAVPTFAASDATVGVFVIKLAKARNLNATDARVAADSLRGVGIRLPADLDYGKPLTEGDVTRISQTLGLNVTTATPENPFGSDQVDRFFVSFASDIAAGTDDTVYSADDDGDGPAFNPYSKGKGGSKGKKKGHDFTPTDPE